MTRTEQIPEIGAEMLLNLLYPELQDRWTVHHEGTFYRNYNRDVLSVSEEDAEVWLSRDSLLRLLPQGLFTTDEDLKQGDIKEKHKELEQQLKILKEAFLPFDTLTFRRQLHTEQQVASLVSGKLPYVLKTYYGFDWEAQQNPYVRELGVLLPFIRERRGDLGLIRRLLECLFRCPVEQREHRYSQEDSTRCWIPLVRFELLKEGLDAREYQSLRKDLEPLAAFLEEWFMPVEVRLELAVKQHGKTPQLGEALTLDYNTEL